MATLYLREKINLLNNMIQAEDLQAYQNQLLVDAANKPSGDAQVDQSMKSNASNLRAALLASSVRLEHYRSELAKLTAELEGTTAP